MSENPARLLLVRHGQTGWHGENRYVGSSDIGLTEQGREQARALVRCARSEQPALIVCSSLKRALETARPAAEACSLKLKVDDRLREVDFGEWEGRTLAEIRESDPSAVERFEEDPVRYGFPGGEPLPKAAQRVLKVFRELDEAYAGQTVLVVAHNTLLRLGLCELLGIPLKDYRRRMPRLANTAISEVRLSHTGGALYSLNDARYLGCEM
ncbi:MAG: histidine phosphatase family protein [Rubrobacteraceae bacterium]|nr:histidine phosphatase family protein [Rubrobacteraceae bacterium]